MIGTAFTRLDTWNKVHSLTARASNASCTMRIHKHCSTTTTHNMSCVQAKTKLFTNAIPKAQIPQKKQNFITLLLQLLTERLIKSSIRYLEEEEDEQEEEPC